MPIKYTSIRTSCSFFIFLLGLLMTPLSMHAQIVSGETLSEEEKEKEKNEKKEKDTIERINRDSLTGTTFYMTGLYNYSMRTFQDNSVYGSFAEWNNQTPDVAYGGTIGVFLPIGNNLQMDIGFTYFGHKEQYSFVDQNSDSTFSYWQSYMQLGMPLKLRYTYGEKFQVFGFVGLTPLNILNIRLKEDYTTMAGGIVDRDMQIVKDKIAIFNLMGSVGGGITYNMDWVGVTIYPEFRQHFFNSYDPQKPIQHRMYGIGINAGLTLRF